MKVFVTGVTGQLGHDVVKELLRRGHIAIGSGGRPQPTEQESIRWTVWQREEREDMKVFVTGVGGQLGHDCVNELVGRGHEAVTKNAPACSLT